MDELLVLFWVFVFLFIFLTIVAVIGHLIWISVAWFFRSISGKRKDETANATAKWERCIKCGELVRNEYEKCFRCGTPKPSEQTRELKKELEATWRQAHRLHRAGAIDNETYDKMKAALQTERDRLLGLATPQPTPIEEAKPIITQTPIETWKETIQTPIEPIVTFRQEEKPMDFVESVEPIVVQETVSISSHIWSTEQYEKDEERRPPIRTETYHEPISPQQPRRTWTEVVEAFMEQSNIRWGEIIGGLIIIGCSTALVISLWSTISQNPFYKFVFFTLATSIFFLVGFYTEHRWKLPTTSRGILTIATLLVPLNFLAVAAVSSSQTSNLVFFLSEVFAPALFFAFVYFAGRVLTPNWAQVLAVGVLGSSIGQILIHHFATPDMGQGRVLGLGIVTTLCFVSAVGWMLFKSNIEDEITEPIANSIFITLGASVFAAFLPLGLLLFKSNSAADSLMWVTPLISLCAAAFLTCGAFLWKRIDNIELAYSRLAGTSIAIIGAMVVVAAMLLAFPNPTSIVLSALISFCIFTWVAILLNLPIAHAVALFSFTLAYIVGFQVVIGRVGWQLPRSESVIPFINSPQTGQLLAPLFLLYLVVSELLRRRSEDKDSQSYFVGSLCVVAISFLLLAYYGFALVGDVYFLTLILAVYSFGFFFYAWTRKLAILTWVGSAFLILSLTQGFGFWYGAPFGWQTAMLIYASIATIAAHIFWRNGNDEHKAVFVNPFRFAALISSGFVIIALIQSRFWQSTAMITTKLFWLSLIWFGLLWLIRSRWLFAATQAVLMCACLLTTKLILQSFDWYGFQPLVYLHPSALHIYGSVILSLTIAWTIFRIIIGKQSISIEEERNAQRESAMSAESENITQKETSENETSLLHLLNSFFNTQTITFDRLAAIFVFASFVYLTIYGAMHGVVYELSLLDDLIKLPDIANYSHTFAYGFTAWIVVVLLLVTMLLLIKEKARYFYLFVIIITLSLACPLFASGWEEQIAVASAWRWVAAVFLVLSFLAIQKRETILSALGLPDDENHQPLPWLTEKLTFFVSVFPILILTLHPLYFVASGYQLQSSGTGFFNSIGFVISYTLPLAIVSIVFSLQAVIERNSRSALFAGLVATFAVVTAHLFSVYSTNGAMDRTVATQSFQLIAISASAFSILWLATRKLWSDADDVSRYSLQSLISLGAAANILLITPVALRLFSNPELVGIGTLETGSVRGWLGLILCLVAIAWLHKAFEIKIKTGIIFVSLLFISSMAAFTLARSDNHTNWRGYHVLFIGMIATAWLMWLINYLPERLQTKDENEEETKQSFPIFEDYWNFKTAIFSSLAILFVVVMAFRSTVAPTTHWWSVAPLMIVAVLAACLFTTTLNRLFMYASSVLLCFAASVWFAFSWDRSYDHLYGFSVSESSILSFFNGNLVAIGLVGVASFLLEKRLREFIPEKSLREIIPPFNKFAFIVVFCILLLFLFAGIGSDLNNQHTPTPNVYLFSVTLFIFGILAFTSLWDLTSKASRLVVYLYCLLTSLLILDRFNFQLKEIILFGMVVIGTYALLTTLLWWQREKLSIAASRLKIVLDINETLTWLRFFNFALVVVTIFLSTIVVFYFEDLSLRLLASIIAIAQLFTLGLLAEGEQRKIWQSISLVVFSLGLSLFGCAWLQPWTTGTWMNRSVVLMIVMFVLLATFGGLKAKMKDVFDDWLDAAKQIAPLWVIVSALSLFFVLTTEVAQQIQYGKAQTQTLALIVVAITLLSGAAACIAFAVKEEYDPLALSEKGRMNYVYVAESLLVLLFMHIRLSRPEWFSGFFEKYWTLVVVILAYLGIGLSEFFRRRNLTTLSTPIERTGIFLPLLPVLGFWIVNSRVDYSLILFSIGVLYGLLSLLRRSFGFGVLAALAGNGGLWYALHRTDSFGVIQHPQFWFIPLAVSVLIAAYLNRDNFKEEEITGIRYIALMMIYVSSTVDIFINGVATSPWLPLVLMLLSVAGVMLGIMFRIRAFLFLGSLFLLISIVTMIYYASSALEWTWLWWVAGIFLGGTILFIFALFEKKKQEMLRMLEDMRAWEK